MRGIAVAALFLLAACGDGETREGELSADEERQLNDAAAMLDEPEDGGEDEAEEARTGDDAEQ